MSIVGFEMTFQLVQFIFLFLFLCISCGILVIVVISLTKKGLQCGSAFIFMWMFAYPLPALIYLLFPNIIANTEGYAWMTQEQWCFAAMMAMLGLVAFSIGYSLKKSTDSQAAISVPIESVSPEKFWQLLLLAIGVGLQLIPLFLIVRRGISINFVHRGVHWGQVGLGIRLAYFALPVTAIAAWFFFEKKSSRRFVISAFALSISCISAVILGARMFAVLIPTVILLIYADLRPKKRFILFSFLFVAVLVLSIGYTILLRSGGRNATQNAAVGVILTDIGRMHTLAYTSGHIDLISSDILYPPS